MSLKGIGGNYVPANTGSPTGVGLPKNWWLIPAVVIGMPLLFGKRERGFLIFEDANGVLGRGETVVGTPDSVAIDLDCPEGMKPKAIFHTHSHDPNPSPADLETGMRLNLPMIIKCGDQIKCYRVKDEDELIRFAREESEKDD